jgi:hypothetical protein
MLRGGLENRCLYCELTELSAELHASIAAGSKSDPATKRSFLFSNSRDPAIIRIDNFEFQYNASERMADDKYDRNSFRIARYPLPSLIRDAGNQLKLSWRLRCKGKPRVRFGGSFAKSFQG